MGTNNISWKHFLSPRFIASKVREKGVIYCARWGVKLIWKRMQPVRAVFWTVPDKIRYTVKKQSTVLHAFYDLKVSPATFDIVKFLLLAERQRKQKGCNSLHVVIVPGPAEGFRRGDLEVYRQESTDTKVDYLQWRLNNILVPCCRLVPSCRQVTVCASREEAQIIRSSLVKHVFPERYNVRYPVEKYALRHITVVPRGAVFPSIQATPQALRFVSDWIKLKTGGRKVVTIGLRESSYQLDRNSNLKAWGAFARSLDPRVYCPVIVRDTETAFNPLPPELDGVLVFEEVSWNIELRAALHELSYLNLMVNSGMNALCLYNQRVRCLTFKMITPSSGSTTEDFFRSEGLEPGSQLPILTPYQRLVWEDDSLEVLQKAFREMCEMIENSS